MSNHARRRRRVITPTRIFPTKTQPRSAWEVLDPILMKMDHKVIIHDLGHNTCEVACSCGLSAPAPFGQQQAEKIKEDHLARYHVIHDPTGAKYRA